MGNVKNTRKNYLLYSSDVFRQYVLGTAKIGKRHNVISLYHSSLHLMAGVSNDSKTAIKAILFIYIFLLHSAFSSHLFACRSKLCAKQLLLND